MSQASPVSASPAAKLIERIRALRDALLTGLVERDVAIRLALIAALAGEHLLLLGPPGTAKSLVARRLRLAFADASYFERLLTRFTVPEELFGPLSIKGLEEDRYERLTACYLPTASIAFLDEIFKANSAILNSLLTLLNEREFDNGTKRTGTPLIAVIGASNELPEGEELDALFDRFLLRLHVGPVSKDAFPALLGLRGQAVPVVADDLRLTAGDLAAVQSVAERVTVPDDVVAMLCDLRDWCTAEHIQVSDRRWRKIVKLLQVAALTNGRDRVSVWDCWLLQHCLWDKPEDREKVYTWYAARVGAGAAMDPSRLTKIVVSWEGKLKADQDSRSQARDVQGQLLFKGGGGKPTTQAKGKAQAKRGNDALFLSPANGYNQRTGMNAIQQRRLQGNVPDRTNGGNGYTLDELNQFVVQDRNGYGAQHFMHWPDREAYLADQNNWFLVDIDLAPMLEPTRHKTLYIDACIREVDDLRANVAAYKADLLQHMAAMEKDIRGHLWVTSDFVEPASESLKQTRTEVDTLASRVDKIKKGFELLPREGDGRAPQATANAPQPSPKNAPHRR